MTKVLFGTISSLYLTLRLYGYTKISGVVLNVLLLYTTNEKSQSADCELYRFPLGTTRFVRTWLHLTVPRLPFGFGLFT